MSEVDRSCGACAAFMRVIDAPSGERTGDCALEVYAPPVSAAWTCSRYRPKGALAAELRPRVAGEPRRHFEPKPRSAPHDAPVQRGATPTPIRAFFGSLETQEIDIDMNIEDFRRVLREVLTDELGISRPALGQRWQGGELVMVPGNSDTQEKRVPLESFFHKIVMVRDKLRVLEQRLNTHEVLSAEEKVQLQSYVTACYGSLTTFNVLFAEKDDQFSSK
ncbi:MAG: hypothetical protein EXR75_05275 [Myxococcales bacterium]|nr:hypothetical protein [Myxococcales bacterium]